MLIKMLNAIIVENHVISLETPLERRTMIPITSSTIEIMLENTPLMLTYSKISDCLYHKMFCLLKQMMRVHDL